MARFRAGDYEAAAAFFEQARQADPTNMQAYNLLGYCYLSLNRKGEAFAVYNDAVRANPGKPDPYHYLGNAYRQTGDFVKAEEAYRKAIDLAPADPTAHVKLGELFAQRGDMDKALAEYQYEILRLKARLAENPDDPQPEADLARFYLDHDIELKEALTRAERAAKAAPDNNRIGVTYAQALAKNGRTDEAISLLETVIARESNAAFKRYYQNLLNRMRTEKSE